MSEEDLSRVEAKLDTLIAIQRVAHAEALERLTEELRGDRVAVAVIRAARNWTSAGEIKSKAAVAARASKPTVERRIAELLHRGVLQGRGSGPAVEYRSSGLVEL